MTRWRSRGAISTFVVLGLAGAALAGGAIKVIRDSAGSVTPAILGEVKREDLISG